MPTPPRTRRVEQINFGLSQGRSSINAIASLLSSSLRTFRVPLLFSSPIHRPTSRARKRARNNRDLCIHYQPPRRDSFALFSPAGAQYSPRCRSLFSILVPFWTGRIIARCFDRWSLLQITVTTNYFLFSA